MSESTNHNHSCREARNLRATEFRDLKRLGPDLTGTISCSGLPLCICVTSIECMKSCESTAGCKYAIMVAPVTVTFAPSSNRPTLVEDQTPAARLEAPAVRPPGHASPPLHPRHVFHHL